MATDKPRFSLTIPDDILAQVEKYQAENGLSTKSKAIHRLIEIGLSENEDGPQTTRYVARSSVEEKYAALDAHGRRVVDLVMGAEAERVEAEKTAVEEVPQEPPMVKIVPLFPAAAGPGEPVDGSVFDSYELPADSQADFAVRISGDSMEPELHHGDIVLCKKRKPMEGELAAIMVNGFLYVKQVEPDKYGNLHLLSINRARKNLDVHIPAESSDTVRLYGTLIHRMMPPIDWRE